MAGMARFGVRSSLLLVCIGLISACGSDGEVATTTEPPPAVPAAVDVASPLPGPSTSPPVPEAVTSPARAGSEAVTRPTAPASTAPAPRVQPRVRAVTQTAWSPFATVGGVTLTHPAARVERVGFHESSHDGARQLQPAPTAVAAVTVDSRGRGTGSRTAADVVVDPAGEIRSPVTGRVKRAGRYVLYCRHSDDYVVVEPDTHPGWEVKILHIDGERVTAGDRLTAGQTVIAGRATQLPFASQVDELRTADPAWPHVHIEVIDLAIPDRPSPGGGCP
ncbi:MAG: hypothetical protein AVDCRST_MAG76-1441 [uncultured Acidimicrobiales bacterium]|uniref:Peptidase M23 domain-containing protein n=1 Tax=uncultured Acidimicrobiales bacterium TaxID=310071 RepID=A0A6J4HWE7_9ACTN|nr:MAG: hypothetical protein AVDCRST_MAG76-1441 [uncultured Acidimicrobiales bacterium]